MYNCIVVFKLNVILVIFLLFRWNLVIMKEVNMKEVGCSFAILQHLLGCIFRMSSNLKKVMLAIDFTECRKRPVL